MFRPADPGAPVDDDLLAVLSRDSVAAGPDLVATIRAAQDDVVSTELDRVLIVQGGPGTGKTMTALRRVAWLLDEGLLDDAETLVVGPSEAFARFTDDVLTGWGYDRVVHRAVGALLSRTPGVRDEAPHIARLKGESRMVGLLKRAYAQHQSRPAAEVPASIDVGGQTVKLDSMIVRRMIETAVASEAPIGDRRRILRATMAAASKDPRLVLEAADQLADRLWPRFEPARFLRELFGSRKLLAAAAGGEFTDREVASLYRHDDSDLWFDADLPLLDEVDHLTGLEVKGFLHVVVDEAQDLSPMQMRAIARRSRTGSITVVGDIAQSTGLWARDDWHDLEAELPAAIPHEHRELRFGYRIPRQIFDLAAELLPMAAPSVQAPTTVRDGNSEPVITPADVTTRGRLVATAAAEHADRGRSVAVVCPARCRAEVEAALDDEGLPWHPAGDDEPGGAGVALLAPHEAKGLEFDAAVVVEPGYILDDDSRGHRLLYIALTRATGFLHLIGAPEDLPVEYGAAAAPPAAAPLGPTPPGPAPTAAAPAAAGTSAPAGTSASEGSGASVAAEAGASTAGADALLAQREPVTWSPPPRPAEPELEPAVREAIDVVVRSLAETLLGSLTPELWPVALRRLEDLIAPEALP
ncbi:AAA family ATPase [Paractinoplanes ferrugineus]|uniref:DNA helicase n=1 Tax=Paractinoplanes ferrugineus TaxID=113564 RepID=A0A919J255_9ACTN|nr:AAA family ATPase [Actinoplanes ferrugineus]GIE12072.1 DNA helicase [Actinoplanes ferrugineus]